MVLTMRNLIFVPLLTATFIFSLSAETQKPEHIPMSIWEAVTPYLIPEDHPMKNSLDEIFSAKRRVVHSSDTLKKAGFKNTRPGKWTSTIVAKHPKLTGYLVKMYTDDQKNKIDWAKFLDRVRGSKAVQEAVDAHDWHDLFKVPQKWIYLIPENPAPPAGRPRKNFILLVEDMDLISKKANLRKWERSDLPKKFLNAVFILLKEVGLRDSVYAFNLPFSTDGRIAFVDTEYYHMWPVHYRSLLQYLSQGNREYWKQIINNKYPVERD
jgi:hypothetical protein